MIAKVVDRADKAIENDGAAGKLAAVIGISLGSALILALEQTGMDFSAAFSGVNLEISSIVYPDLKVVHILLMSIYTVGISALVTLIPCRKAAKIEPVDAISAT